MPRDLTIPAERHPEKARRAESAQPKKPAWIRVKAPVSEGYRRTRDIVRENRLVTVCEEAGCPNVGECWSQGHATMMIMGGICTRAARSATWPPGGPTRSDAFEPGRVAHAVATLGLAHVVVTSVDRDDLADGGAEHFAQTIRAIRHRAPGTTIEVLTPDFLRCGPDALETVVEARPDVFNHTSRRSRASTPRSAPARGTSTPCACYSGSRSSTGPRSRSRASWWGWARAVRRCSRSWTTCAPPAWIS